MDHRSIRAVPPALRAVTGLFLWGLLEFFALQRARLKDGRADRHMA